MGKVSLCLILVFPFSPFRVKDISPDRESFEENQLQTPLSMKFICSLIALLFACSLQQATAQNWNLTQKLGSSDQSPADNLGISTAISDSFMLAGAWWEDGDPTSPITSAGAAYLYKQQADGTWLEIQKLISPNPENLGYFGFNVALEGKYALVGAFNEDEGGVGNAGVVYVYERGFNDTMLLKNRLVAPDGQGGDLFGYAVALTDGYALIGAHENSYDETGDNFLDASGAAYLFKRQPTGAWSLIRKLVAFDREAGAYFGKFLDIDNLGLIIGAFDADNSSTLQFGVGAAYGAYCNDSLLVWGYDNVTSADLQKITASDQDNFEAFGLDVAISGKWAVIGKSNEPDQPGGGIASNTGSAYFFHWENGGWVEKQKVYASDFAANSLFGRAIGIDGSVCIIGASTAREDMNGGNSVVGAGEAYVFELQPNGQWLEVEQLSGTERAANDLYGETVDVSGTTVVVGAWLADSLQGEYMVDRGAVYVYERDQALSIPQLPDLQGLMLLRNPSPDGKLTIQETNPSPLPLQIRVFSLTGQELFAETLSPQQQHQIDLSYLPSGVYLLQIQRAGYVPWHGKWQRQ